MSPQNVLLFLVCSLGLAAGQVLNYVLKGSDMYMAPTISGEPDEIVWRHNGDMVVEFNGREQLESEAYENRITLDWASAELTIANARYEDSGDYELDVFINKLLKQNSFKWKVLDKVAKPSISCEMNDGNGATTSGTHATLVCSAQHEHPQSLDFQWISPGNVQPGPNLTISLEDKDENEVYSCLVSNPVSHDRANFTVKDCYLDKSSSVLPIVIPVICAIVIIGLMVLGYVFRRRLKACCGKDDEDFERQPSGICKGSNEGGTPGDERSRLLDRAPTLPSNQQLARLMERNQDLKDNVPERDNEKDAATGNEPVALGDNDEANATEDEVRAPSVNHTSECETSDSDEDNGRDAAGTEDDQSDTQTFAAACPEADEDEGAGPDPVDGVTATPQHRSPLARTCPNHITQNTIVELEEDDGTQMVGETTEEDVRESDLSGAENSSTSLEQRDSGTEEVEQESEVTQRETHRGYVGRQKTDTPVCGEEAQSDQEVSDSSTAEKDRVEGDIDKKGAGENKQSLIKM